MKHFIYTLILGICTVLVSSCSGTSDDVMDGKIHLKADKTSIMADGADCVTFTVKRDGEDLSNAATMQLEVTDENGSVSTLAEGANTFSSTKAGKYSIRAKYYESGYTYSEETIEVTVNPIGESKYKHVLLGMEFTSEGCTACPNFARALEQIKEENNDKMVVVAFHMNFLGVPDFLHLDETVSYLQSLGARSSLPQFYFNIRKNDETLITRDKVLKAMAEELTIPNTCGVAIDTKYDDASRKLNITAKITSDVDKEYRYVVYLVEDNIPQRLQGVEGFIHQNAVRKVLTSTIGNKFPNPIPANQEVAVALPEVEIPEDWNTENMRVVVSMVSSLDGGKSYTSNNTAQCKLGESVDYQLNE